MSWCIDDEGIRVCAHPNDDGTTTFSWGSIGEDDRATDTIQTLDVPTTPDEWRAVEAELIANGWVRVEGLA